MAKRYTHFIDRDDGKGSYRDYNDMGRVLRRHSEATKTDGVAASWIKDYGADGEDDRVLADWKRTT